MAKKENKANNNILLKTSNKKLYLSKIHAEKVENHVAGEIENYTRYTYEILENTKEKLLMKINSSAGFKPSSIMELSAEYIIEYALKEPISEDEVKEGITQLAAQIGSELSFLFAFLCDKMINYPFILAPIFKLDAE